MNNCVMPCLYNTRGIGQGNVNTNSGHIADIELFTFLLSFSYSPVLKVHVKQCLHWHSLEEESVLPWAS